MNEQLPGTPLQPDLQPQQSDLEPYDYDYEPEKPKQPVNKLNLLMVFVWVAVLILVAFFLLNQDQNKNLSTAGSSTQTAANSTSATSASYITPSAAPTPLGGVPAQTQAPVMITSGGGSGGSSSNSGAGTSTSSTNLSTDNAYNYYQTLANGQLVVAATPTPTPAPGSTPTPTTNPTNTPTPSNPNVLGAFTGSTTTSVTGVLAQSGSTGWTRDMAVGADGFVRYVYPSTNGAFGINFVQCTNAACTTKNSSFVAQDTYGTASASDLMQTSIAMAPDGYARIAYYIRDNGGTGAGQLHYIVCSDAQCSSPSDNLVAGGAGGQPLETLVSRHPLLLGQTVMPGLHMAILLLE